jgi:hypothetical protein
MKQPSMKLVFTVAIAALGPDCTSGASLRKAEEVPKKDMIIKDPLSNPAGDLMPVAPKPVPREQEYDHGYVPLPPPARRDMSPTDPIETLHGWEGYVADKLNDMSSKEGKRFEGSTCQSVCSACAIYSAQMSEGQCTCYARCLQGQCDGVLPHIGWSNNDVSTPLTLYRASCGAGEKNCEEECMDDKIKKDIDECKADKTNPARCFHKLAQLNEPLPHDARKQVHYCFREHMSACDTFLNAPKEKEWYCFDDPSKCASQQEIGVNKHIETWAAPSVWQSVQNSG